MRVHNRNFITRIFSSPLLRAIETSVILSGQLGLDYEVTLRENKHAG